MDAGQLENLLEGEDVIVVLFQDDANVLDVFKQVAQWYQDVLVFVATKDTTLRERYNAKLNDVIVLKVFTSEAVHKHIYSIDRMRRLFDMKDQLQGMNLQHLYGENVTVLYHN